MGFALTEYVKIKNNYCVCYLGHETSYLVQLRILRPYIEKSFPELRLYICCNDSYLYLFEGEPRIVPYSQITVRKKEFAFVRELKASSKEHVIEQFMKESNLSIPGTPQLDKDGICLVLPEGTPPVKSVPVQTLERYAKSLGFKPVVVGSDIHMTVKEIKWRPTGLERLSLAKDAKIAIGVECDLLYLTGFYYGKTILFTTGCGIEIYNKIFPGASIAKI